MSEFNNNDAKIYNGFKAMTSALVKQQQFTKQINIQIPQNTLDTLSRLASITAPKVNQNHLNVMSSAAANLSAASVGLNNLQSTAAMVANLSTPSFNLSNLNVMASVAAKLSVPKFDFSKFNMDSLQPMIGKLTELTNMMDISNSPIVEMLSAVSRIQEDFTVDFSKLATSSADFLRNYEQYERRKAFASEYKVVVPGDFLVENETSIDDYWTWVDSIEAELFLRVAQNKSEWANLLVTHQAIDYRIMMPFAFSYVESLLRDLLTGEKRDHFKVGLYKSGVVDISKMADDDPYLLIRFAMAELVTQIATALFPNFNRDSEKTYRNSVLHGFSDPTKWKKEAYQMTLLSIAVLENVKDELDTEVD
ncbi:hypothetical protein P3T51_07985 [Weissella confusa]|uniref:hypothetical protein n=1 Tax=Weissella confusa TaxID=1583 RepID=UPI002407AFD1|nr:hypothetical protein [Weissella confusa]WEY47505.1 hypothetical protein P3T51_07985 [Weissella confusa]